MDIRRAAALAICLSVAGPTGCDNGGAVSSVPHYEPAAATSDSEPSWMSRDTASTALLYVSDWNTNSVFIYDFATHGLLGRLTGFQAPYGQCVDEDGHVWISEFGVSDIVEYSHGGDRPIKRLHTAGHPIGCAIDPRTGKLAVANFYAKGESGSIQVWKNASGDPVTYRSSRFYYLWPPAYDGDGNLFVEGQVRHGPYGIAELPRYGAVLRTVTLKGAAIRYAGGALWDGVHVGLADQDSDGTNTTVIYRTHIAGGVARVVGRTHLTDTCYGRFEDTPQPFFLRTNDGQETIVGGNLWCLRRFDYFNYTAGGNPSHLLARAPKEPFGQSVSLPVQEAPFR
jgi:hypothetical protein